MSKWEINDESYPESQLSTCGGVKKRKRLERDLARMETCGAARVNPARCVGDSTKELDETFPASPQEDFEHVLQAISHPHETAGRGEG